MTDAEIEELFESLILRAKTEGVRIEFWTYSPPDVRVGGKSVVPPVRDSNGRPIPDPDVVSKLQDLLERESTSQGRLRLANDPADARPRVWRYEYPGVGA